MSKQQVRGKIWTLPNLISMSRLVVLLPITITLLLTHHYIWSLVTLFILGFTDWLDGFLARKLDQVSQFGKEMDPLADRVSVLLLGCALIVIGVLPPAFVAVIAGVDFLLAISALIWFRGVPDLPVTMVGKVRTAVLLFALPALILGAETNLEWIKVFGLGLMLLGTVGHVLAGFGYLREMYRQTRGAKRKPASYSD